jgi:hypothetical protein
MPAEQGATPLGRGRGNGAAAGRVSGEVPGKGPYAEPDIQPNAPDADPTLSGTSGVLDATAFPDTATGTRLVLYQSQSGDLDLRWHLDPAVITQARAVFGNRAPPLAVVRLLQLHEGGKPGVIADAPLAPESAPELGPELAPDASTADGFARYQQGAEGLLAAEIGFTSPSGGWVLVARSNRLQAVRPVGAVFLRTPPAVAADLQRKPVSDRQSVLPATMAAQAQTRPAPSSPLAPPTLSPSRLEPEFPMVSAPAQQAVGTLAAAVVPGGRSPDTTGDRTSALGLAMMAPIQSESRQLGPDGAAAVGLGAGAQRGSLPPDLIGRVEPRLVAVDAPAESAVGAAAFNGVEAGDGADGQFARMPGDGNGADRVEPAADGAVGPVVDGVADGGAGRAVGRAVGPVRGGSGPIRPARPDLGAEIHAELLVYGSGAPGMWLDLGGHAYRIGRGGRFSFRLPINDPDLILTLLSALPELPVTPRGGEDGDRDS